MPRFDHAGIMVWRKVAGLGAEKRFSEMEGQVAVAVAGGGDRTGLRTLNGRRAAHCMADQS
jgi:hypothetical protein